MAKSEEQAPPPSDSPENDVWVEEYRPTTLDDVAGQEEIISELKKYVMSRVGWAAGLLAVWIARLNYLMG